MPTKVAGDHAKGTGMVTMALPCYNSSSRGVVTVTPTTAVAAAAGSDDDVPHYRPRRGH